MHNLEGVSVFNSSALLPQRRWECGSQRRFYHSLRLIKTNDSRCCIASGKRMDGWCVCVGGLPSLPISFILLRKEHTVVLTQIPEHIVHCRGKKGGDLNANVTVCCITRGVKSDTAAIAKVLSLGTGGRIVVMVAGQ